MSKRTLIIINILLVFIVLGLGGFLLYDKVIKKEDIKENYKDESKQGDNKEDKEEIEHKELSYFEEYLTYFMPSKSANNFLRDMDDFNEDDISSYLLFYYINKVNSEELEADPVDEYIGNLSYTVSKEEVNKVIFQYFGKKNIELEDSNGRMGVRSLDEDTYQFYWFATGWMAPMSKAVSLLYDGKKVSVDFLLTYEYEEEEEQTLRFFLEYDDGIYHVKSIQLLK